MTNVIPPSEISVVKAKSSEYDVRHPPENLLKTNGIYKWMTPTRKNGSPKRFYTTIAFKRPWRIGGIRVVNSNASLIEVFVGQSSELQSDHCLLPKTQLSGFMQASKGINLNKSHHFPAAKLISQQAAQPWSQVTISVQQPYNKALVFGLASVSFETPDSLQRLDEPQENVPLIAPTLSDPTRVASLHSPTGSAKESPQNETPTVSRTGLSIHVPKRRKLLSGLFSRIQRKDVTLDEPKKRKNRLNEETVMPEEDVQRKRKERQKTEKENLASARKRRLEEFMESTKKKAEETIKRQKEILREQRKQKKKKAKSFSDSSSASSSIRSRTVTSEPRHTSVEFSESSHIFPESVTVVTESNTEEERMEVLRNEPEVIEILDDSDFTASEGEMDDEAYECITPTPPDAYNRETQIQEQSLPSPPDPYERETQIQDLNSPSSPDIVFVKEVNEDDKGCIIID
eukprot:m.246957 g.246957  ORF g.246957 m.246957 type:complete len:458 (+) comp16122_c0_seq1:339-1712(+)